ncbi:MFS transporter [Streptomyces sp. H39-S7]|uniref:MFS transporter n=1 Tax=Streptomyces sp. H39-S7 TaxID=3004357 RepID=UPI0022B05F1C|nr:MFS transporter [Streptomyces sp. H39-S7]MCZ4119900.1 MFS transporter [Streptomyces sp. H39-S7]
MTGNLSTGRQTADTEETDESERDAAATGPPAEGKGAGYRQVLALPAHSTWYAAAAMVRAPVVMAPLALVFVGYSTGSFAAGGILAAAHALGEAAAAPLMGRLFDTRPFVRQLRLSLVAEAIAFTLLAVFMTDAPLPVLIALAALAGGSAAGAPGGMRAQLSTTTPADLRPTALSLESSLSQTVWAVSPPLVSLLYVQLTARGALLAIALIAVTPVLFAGRIAHSDRHTSATATAQNAMPTRQVLRLAWPTALLSASIMFLIGTVDVLLPARLTETGSGPALAGPVMTAFAVASVLAGLVYGLRRWPGTPRVQSLALLLAMAAAFTTPALMTHPLAFAAAFAVGGLFFSPLMVIRNVTLQDRLPQRAWATGFSLLYAAGGLGYGAAGLMSAAMLRVVSAGETFAVCTAVTAAIGLASLVAERGRAAAAPADAVEPEQA